MDDVRAQFIAAVSRYAPAWDEDALDGLAEVILERFDVTPKPVVTDEALGNMAMRAACVSGGDCEYVGGRLRIAIEAAGLQIVRVPE